MFTQEQKVFKQDVKVCIINSTNIKKQKDFTPKPVNLVADYMLDCSNIDGIVIDTFLGSGTSLIAAQKAKRILYGMEIEPNYVDHAVQRWIKFMQKESLDYEVKLNGEIWKAAPQKA